MKRNNTDLHHCEVTVTYVKRERRPGAKAPDTLLPNPITLTQQSQSLLNPYLGASHLRFVVFLDAQGKEYVSELSTLCRRHLAQMVFCTAYEDPTSIAKNRFTDTHTCKTLAKELRILNPVGGGAYPLNHLVVLDALSAVHCMLPIRLGRYYGPHQRFGVSLRELPGILEEYELFAQTGCWAPQAGEDVVMAT